MGNNYAKDEIIEMFDNFFEKHPKGNVILLYPSETSYVRENIHGMEIKKDTYKTGRVRFMESGICIRQSLGLSLVTRKHLFLPYGNFSIVFDTMGEERMEMIDNEEFKKLSTDEQYDIVIGRLNAVMDKYKQSGEKQGYSMAVFNLANVVEHIEKCYDFDMEFPSD